MSEKEYHIKPSSWLLKDQESVRFHIDNDDYFGTIAAILSLIKQQLKRGECNNASMIKQTLQNLEKDLVFLQDNYQINPKIRNKKITPKGSDSIQ